MKKWIALFTVFFMCVVLSSCGNKQIQSPPTSNEIKAVLEAFLEPQIQAYEKAFGIDDLSVEISFKEFSVDEAYRSKDGTVIDPGFVSCTIRDIIICPSIAESLANGEFTDDMLKQLSTIEFIYPVIPYGDYEISVFSALMHPIFLVEGVDEFTISEWVLLKGSTIAYISSAAKLEYDAKVGDNIYAIIGANGSSGNVTPKKICTICNGTGYVKYYYGSSDLEAYLDGYDPYTVGKCTSCKGKGK